MLKAAWIGAGLVAIALVGWGCGQGGFSERRSETATANVLRYPIPNNPTTLDPHTVQDGDTIDFLQQVYEGLVGWDENNEVTGLLAEKWTVSEDGKTYTFTLRDAKFQNGRAVTADDVVWSLERATNPKLASPVAANYLDDIVGVREKLAGEADTLAGVKKVSDKEVSLTLTRAVPYFLGKLTYLTAAVLPKESVPADNEITTVAEMVGTGPFRVVDFKPEQLVRMESFKEYWGGAPKLAGVERMVLGDAMTRLNKFKNGEIEMVQLERQDLKGVQEDPKLKDQVKFMQRAAIWYIGMNGEAYAPFKNRDVRRAFAMAIDRDKIVNDLLDGVNQPARSILPPGVPGHREEANYLKFNVEEAKALLAKAGYPNGQGMPTLTMTFRDKRPDIRVVAEAVASQLQQNLGVKVTLQAQEWASYLEQLNRKEQAFFHMRWSADYLDPQNFLSLMLTTNGAENKIGYSNPEVDRLCAEADAKLNMDERLPLYAQAEDLILQDAPWVPIYYQRDIVLVSPRVKDLRLSLFGYLPHTKASVTDAPAAGQ